MPLPLAAAADMDFGMGWDPGMDNLIVGHQAPLDEHTPPCLGSGHYINTDYINIEYIDYIDYIDDYIDHINANPPSSDSGGPILPLAVMPH